MWGHVLQVNMSLTRVLKRLSGSVLWKQGLESLGGRLQHTDAHSSALNYQLLSDCLGERERERERERLTLAFQITTFLYSY